MSCHVFLGSNIEYCNLTGLIYPMYHNFWRNTWINLPHLWIKFTDLQIGHTTIGVNLTTKLVSYISLITTTNILIHLCLPNQLSIRHHSIVNLPLDLVLEEANRIVPEAGTKTRQTQDIVPNQLWMSQNATLLLGTLSLPCPLCSVKALRNPAYGEESTGAIWNLRLTNPDNHSNPVDQATNPGDQAGNQSMLPIQATKQATNPGNQSRQPIQAIEQATQRPRQPHNKRETH